MTLDISTHRSTLLQILKDIYTDAKIAPYLGFKGGTAAYMFYNLERFSVDLDFDLLNKDKEDEIFSRIRGIVEKYGEIKDAEKKRFSLFFLLSYQKDEQNIKVEINRRQNSSRYAPMEYLGISMPVMVKEDMFANKLVAMNERKKEANRDIFDVWFFAKNNWPINKKIVEERTGVKFGKFLDESIEKLEGKSNRNILSGMGELLSEEQKRWAKSNLLSDTIFLLKIMRENLKEK